MPVSNFNLFIQSLVGIAAFIFWVAVSINPTFGFKTISDQTLPRAVSVLFISWNLILLVGIFVYKRIPGRPRTWIIFEIIFFIMSVVLEHFATRATTCYISAKYFFTYPCASWTTGMFLISFQITMLAIMIVEEYYCIKRKYN
jgi:hypothetical protein